jgi:AcrR family transcriptional regulator
MAEARRRSQETERLRERIRAVATHLIAERGFGAISIQDVAQQVGMSKQALLYHFPSREALHEAVLAHLAEHGSRHFLQVLEVLTSEAPDRVDRALAHIREMFESEPDSARVVLRELLDRPGSQQLYLRQMSLPWMTFLQDALRRAQQERRLAPELDPEASASLIGTLVLSTFAFLPLGSWTGVPGEVWKERRLREMVRLIEHHLSLR